MNYEQAWQSILGQLQMEMPRASFDTWVRDTQALSYDGKTLTVCVRNAYARDWLESRLSSTIARLLVGILDQANVSVEFVVTQQEEAEEENDDSTEIMDEGLSVEVVDSTRYQDEVHPDRIVLLPGYALRLLKQGDLNPKEMSLWLGFRQAVYGQWRKNQGTVKNIPHWEVTRFAMMSRASFFRELSGKESVAGGLVEIVPEPAGFFTNNRRWDNANRYRVHMAPRLTRHDCAVLENILTAEASMAVSHKEGQKLILASLENLASRSPAEYLEGEIEIGKSWPRGIVEIIRRVLSIEGDIPSELVDAAERLQDHIIRSYGNVVITHYFLREVVPLLGLTHPQVWAIILLRDMCWYDYHSRVQHEFAVIVGGLDTLAKWIGVNRKSLDRWLGKLEFSAFVQKVSLDNLGEIPEEWLKNGTELFLISLEEPLLGEALAEIVGAENGTKRDSVWDKVRLVPGQNETRYWTKRDSILDKMRLDLGQSETRLNNLIKPLLTIGASKASTNRLLSSENAKGTSGWSGRRDNFSQDWDLEKLFQTLNINPTTQENIRKTHIPGWALVAWVLRAFTLRGVNEPVGFAISRVASPKTRYQAGGDCELLAKSPEKLFREIKRALHPYRYEVISDEQREAYQRLFSSSQSLAITLWFLLTGEEECEGMRVFVESERVSLSFEQEN